jgi:ATP-binding cassette subfamily C protein
MATLFIVALLLVTEPLLTLVLIGVVGLGSLVLVVFLHHVLAGLGATALRARLGRLQSLQQALSSVKEIKVLGRENYFVNEFRKHRVAHAGVQSQSETLAQTPKQVLEAIVAGGLVLCIVIVLLRGRVSGELVSVLALFAMAAFRIMPGINRIVNSYNTMRHASAYVAEASRDMADPRFRSPPEVGLNMPLAFRNDIELRDISFRYADAADPVLKNLSIRIGRGESVGIVGVSGAGKSTLIDVILGLLIPQQGQVLVDGYDIAANPGPWRRLVGYVPQAIALIDDTLRRNVAFGIDDERIDDTLVWHALKLARLEDFSRSLPRGLETTLGERGVRLSGGQRQRAGIARALYGEPEVLVFDEATSSLDNESEHEITNAIDALHGRKTLLIIAHRLSTVKGCDRLVLMHQGRVADSGSFATKSSGTWCA